MYRVDGARQTIVPHPRQALSLSFAQHGIGSDDPYGGVRARIGGSDGAFVGCARKKRLHGVFKVLAVGAACTCH